MPVYAFTCKAHGEFDVWQGIHESHIARCSVCRKNARRVFYPTAIQGNLTKKDRRMGKTRNELFDNLATEGFANKNWRASYEV